MRKNKKEVGRIFCSYSKTVVKKDHVERHGCCRYDPTMIVKPPFCGVCTYGKRLDMNGNLTDQQKEMMNPELPEFVKGDC